MYNVTFKDQHGQYFVWMFETMGEVRDATENLTALGMEWEWGYVNGLGKLTFVSHLSDEG